MCQQGDCGLVSLWRWQKSYMLKGWKRILKVVPLCLSITLGSGWRTGPACLGGIRHLSCTEVSSCFYLVPGEQRWILVQWSVQVSQALTAVQSSAPSASWASRWVGLARSPWLCFSPMDSDCLYMQGMPWIPGVCFSPKPLFRGTFMTWEGGLLLLSTLYGLTDLMSFLKFKFRTTIGSHFWDLLQEVLQQILESLSIPENGNQKEP